MNSLQTKIAIAGIGLTIFGLGYLLFWPNDAKYIAVPSLVLGIILSLLSRFTSPVFDSFTGSSWYSFVYGYIPLQFAAKKAYEQNRDNLTVKFTGQDFSVYKDTLSWFAHALIGSNVDDTGVAVFECKPHLDIFEEIPKQEIFQHDLVVSENGAEFQEKHNNMVKYDRLHIKISEMKTRIKEISDSIRKKKRINFKTVA